MSEKEIAVEIGHLNKYFDELKVLDDVSLSVENGEFVSVIGVSGCGKSTLIRIIGGLEQPTEGPVLVKGSPVKKPSKKTGFVFQDHRLLPWLTVEQNIKLALEPGRKDADAIVEKYLKLVGLSEFIHSYPSQLSGGMAQRVAIARALANQPDILLLDEPFGALDAITRSSVQDWYLSVMSEIKLSTLFITHDIDEAILLSDRIYIMKGSPAVIDGELVISTPKPRNHDFMMTEEFLKFKKSIREML